MRVGDRDLQLLRVVGENGGARPGTVRLLLASYARGGRSEAAARHWTDRMCRAGYLRRAWVLRGAWFTLTPSGGRLVGLVDDDGHATPRVVEAASVIEHTETVTRLRLHLEAAYPEARWIPERTFWQEQQANRQRRFRRPDGALQFPDQRVGVEVELSRKHADRYPGIVGGTHGSLRAVWWFCPPDLAGWLGRTLAAAAARREGEGLFAGRSVTPFEVYPLPAEVRP